MSRDSMNRLAWSSMVSWTSSSSMRSAMRRVSNSSCQKRWSSLNTDPMVARSPPSAPDARLPQLVYGVDDGEPAAVVDRHAVDGERGADPDALDLAATEEHDAYATGLVGE